MPTEEQQTAAIERAKKVHATMRELVAPLVDGEVIVGIDMVVVVRTPPGFTPIRMVIAGDDETQAFAQSVAQRVHLGLIGPPVDDRQEIVPRPASN